MHSYKVVTADGKVKGTKEKNSATTSTESSGAEASEKEKKVMTEAKQSIYRTIRSDTKRRNIEDEEQIVVVDEWGDDGLNAERDPFFAAAAVIINDPDRMSETAKKWRRISRSEKNREELKYKNLYEDERPIAENDVNDAGSRLFGVYVDKKADDNPEWWERSKKHRGKVNIDILEDLTGRIIDVHLDCSDILMILDHHSSFKEHAGKDAAERVAKNRLNISVVQEDSKTGEHKDLIQAADIAIGAMGMKLRDEKPTVIPMNLQRLTKENSKK